MSRIALVLNPVKVDDPTGLVELVAKECADAGWEAPIVLETSVDDPGGGQARSALEQGADVVVAAGGDGTVREVCEALSGTDARLAIVAAGTGNLLARNLGIPLATEAAVRLLTAGTDRRIDLGVLEAGPGSPPSGPDRVFAVMTGMGLDAAMMEEAPEGLKKRVGWAAYVVGAVRGLRRPQFEVEVRMDDDRVRAHKVRTVLIGNVGTLQAGVRMLPDAEPDDGSLDVALISARHAGHLLAVAGQVLRRRHQRHGAGHVESHRATKVTVRARGIQARQLDGDLVDEGDLLVVSILPGALRVIVPRPDGADSADGSAGSWTGAAR